MGQVRLRRARPRGAGTGAPILDGMSLYDDVGGFDVLLAVCRRWNALCLADPVAAHPFSHGTLHPQHDERLAAYLAEALGGPRLYTGGYGDESKVQRMHASACPATARRGAALVD